VTAGYARGEGVPPDRGDYRPGSGTSARRAAAPAEPALWPAGDVGRGVTSKPRAARLPTSARLAPGGKGKLRNWVTFSRSQFSASHGGERARHARVF
jgi:hypothetical protein